MNSLRELRKKAGLSQQQLSELLGVNQTAISQWERGVTTPSSRMLIKLSQIFMTSPSVLLNNEVGDASQWDDPEVMAAVKDSLSILMSSLETDIRAGTDKHQKAYFDMLEVLRHALRLQDQRDRDVAVDFLHSLLADSLRFIDSRPASSKEATTDKPITPEADCL